MINKKWLCSLVLLLVVSPLLSQNSTRYLNESSDEMAARMKWFTDAKFGMFIHFGLYSHLEGTYKGQQTDRYGEWIQANLDIPGEEYSKLIEVWNPVNFNADNIVKLAKNAGMKYLVVTSKHHEGFCLWDSKYTEFDIASTSLKGRDLLRELADACKKHDIIFGTYYSIIDWNHPSQFPSPNAENVREKWSQVSIRQDKKPEYVQYMKNQIEELVKNYDTSVLWFDGDWANWWTLEDGKELYQFVRELKTDIIINNRVAKRSEFTKDFGTPEQRHPDSGLDHYWEACYTMNKTWGYKSFDDNWKTPEEIYQKLNDINSKGGNLLLNIGPDKNGNVPEESIVILQEVGRLIKNDKK